MQNVPRLAAAWQERYTQIPNQLHELAESPREYQLMALLISFRWHPSSPIIPSVETLREAMKCSARTIRRTAAELERRGYIRREERHAADRRQMSNLYVLCGPLLALVTAIEASRDQEERQPWQGRRSSVAGKPEPRNHQNRTRRPEPAYRPPVDPSAYLGGPLGRHIHR